MSSDAAERTPEYLLSDPRVTTIGKMMAMVLADRSRWEQLVAHPAPARTVGGAKELPVRW
jgi:hypothetical protein